MGNIRRIVIDVLKPHEPSIIELTNKLSDLEGVEGVDIAINEIDSKVENAKITIEGSDLVYDKIVNVVTSVGGTVHSIDKVSGGKRLIEEAETPQDV